MPRHLHFFIFLFISLALHALAITAAVYIGKHLSPELPLVLPVQIVNLPQEAMKQLPPVQRPAPVPPATRPAVLDKPVPPGPVPMPKKFGSSDDVSLPKTLPRSGIPEGAKQGAEKGSPAPRLHEETGTAGPLPFLSQKDIDDLARKGMPGKSAGDDSVTLDTDEFMFMSYNRWLKIKVESALKYPELAAYSGYQGTLYIKFDINKDGTLSNIELLKSSGYKILDDEALRSIRDAAPYQPLPEQWHMDRYSIRAAVIFYLGQGYVR